LTQQEERPLCLNITPGKTTELSAHGCGGGNFEIYVKGHLSDVWADWFEGLTIRRLNNGVMVLSGIITDQAALMGILNKIYRLNLTLFCVREIDSKK
jgi:hypothetical protein